MTKLGLAIICSMMLLAGCSSSLKGDANAGPNPGGGFYGAPNIDIGRINP
jgi:PBP1b-binding outer membrane lipoprotein LpoB